RAAAQRAVKLDSRLVIGQGPDHEALEPALGEVAPRCSKEAAAEAQPLKLRPQVNFVDFTVVEQAACPIAPVIGVAGDTIAESEQGNTAALANRAFPPRRTTPADQLFQLRARNDTPISISPSLVVGFRHRHGVARFGAANLYQGGVHGRRLKQPAGARSSP